MLKNTKPTFTHPTSANLPPLNYDTLQKVVRGEFDGFYNFKKSPNGVVILSPKENNDLTCFLSERNQKMLFMF